MRRFLFYFLVMVVIVYVGGGAIVTIGQGPAGMYVYRGIVTGVNYGQSQWNNEYTVKMDVVFVNDCPVHTGDPCAKHASRNNQFDIRLGTEDLVTLGWVSTVKCEVVPFDLFHLPPKLDRTTCVLIPD